MVINMKGKNKDNAPKAVKRHKALAAERKRNEERLKNELHNLKVQNKKTVRDYRADIKKLAKDHRPIAKEKLKTMIEEMKMAENKLNEEYRRLVKERKNRKRSAGKRY